MKSFEQFLTEARRNPEQNPKISAYDALEKYKDDEDIYISFTSVDKIGMNPKSPYNTPLAIYTYPLKEIFKEFDHKRGHVEVPFAGKAPYIWVVRQKKEKFVKDLYTDYTSADFDRDMAKLEKMYGDKLGVSSATLIKYSSKLAEIILKRLYETPSTSQQTEMMDFIKEILNGKPIEWEVFTEKMNAKFGESTEWERLDKVPYSRFSLSGRVMANVNNYNREFRGVNTLVAAAAENSSIKSPAGSFWYVTMRLSSMLAGPGSFDDRKITASADVVKWNSVFRSLGYSGFADKSGKGIIHPSEPTQAIFLDKSTFEVVEKVMNVNPKASVKTPKELMVYVDQLKVREEIEILSGDIMIALDLIKGDWINEKQFKQMLNTKEFMKWAVQIGDNLDRGLIFPKLFFKHFRKLDTKTLKSIAVHINFVFSGRIDDPASWDVWFKEYNVSKKDQNSILMKMLMFT